MTKEEIENSRLNRQAQVFAATYGAVVASDRRFELNPAVVAADAVKEWNKLESMGK